MGKFRRQRQKFHLPASSNLSQATDSKVANLSNVKYPLLSQPENIFSGSNISFASLKKTLNDDAKSVISMKSVKSEAGGKLLTKKDKLRLRHEILLHKIDKHSQMKKKSKERRKRKNNVIIGDTNALHDALPSLDSLFKASRDMKIKVQGESTKKKGVAKTKKRQKNVVEGVNMIKKIIANKQYAATPLNVLCDKVKQRVQSGNL